MNSSMKIAFAALAICAISGCGEREPGVYVAEKSRLIRDMAPGDVIVAVNGEKKTKRDFDSLQALYGMMYGLANGTGVDLTDPQTLKFLKNRAPQTAQELISRTLMRQEADKKGIKADAADMAAAKEKFAKNFTKSGIKDFEGAAKRLGERAAALAEEILECDIRSVGLRRAEDPGAFEVSEQEIDEGLARVKRVQDECAASNALVRAKMEVALREVTAGGDWAAVAKKNSRPQSIVDDEYKEWQTFESDDFEFEETKNLAAWLATAKAGDVSALMEWEDGIMFVKLLESRKNEDSDEASESTMTYKLARVVENIWDSPEDMTRDEVRTALLKWKEREVQKVLGTRIFSEAVLEYPNGTNWFERAEAR